MRHAKIGAVAATCVGLVVLLAWSTVSAQQAEPKPEKPVHKVERITGESDRGVSFAIKNAVEKIPAPTGDAAKYFRVTSITGKKTAKAEMVFVELEVGDKPFDSAEKT